MIRVKILRNIKTALDSSKFFNFNDFKIEGIDSKSKSSKIKILYEYDPQYFIELSLPSEKSLLTRKERVYDSKGEWIDKTVDYQGYGLDGIMYPGSLSHYETFKEEGVDGINRSINVWLNNLWEEITISPEIRMFMAQKVEIEAIKNKVTGLPDEYFSNEEALDMKLRLEKLESQFADILSKDGADKAETEKQLIKFHQEIEVLKQTIQSLKKESWFKSFVTKTMTWLANPNNQKILKGGKELVTMMLPSGE